MRYLLGVNFVVLLMLLQACAGIPERDCPPGTQDLPDCPPAEAVDDEKIDALYEMRTWLPPSKLTIDPIKLGKEAEIPINEAEARVIGPRQDEALDSLALKIWLIEDYRVLA